MVEDVTSGTALAELVSRLLVDRLSGVAVDEGVLDGVRAIICICARK